MSSTARPETLAFLEKLRAVLDEYPDRFALGEIGGPDSAGRSFADYLGSDRLHTAYSFLFLRADAPTPSFVRSALLEWEQLHAGGWPTWVFSNHDAPRAVSRWGGGGPPDPYAKLLNALLLGLRGSVCLYQGEELGLPQAHVPFERLRDPEAIANWPQTLGRDGARTPIPWRADLAHGGFSEAEPWLPLDPQHLAMAVDRQRGVAGSVLETTRQLLGLRRRHPALARGDIAFHEAPEPVLAFSRHASGDEIYCAFNLGAEPRRVGVADGRSWRAIAGVVGSAAGREFALGPYGFVFAVPAA